MQGDDTSVRVRSINRHMLRSVWLIFLIVILGQWWGIAHGRVFHVSVNRGNDTFPGTESQPFRSIRHASRLVEPGDTVVIHEGLYHEQIMEGASGRQGAPITYEGTSAATVVLDGSVRVRDWKRKGKTWIKEGLNPITPENAFVMVDEKRLLRRVQSRGHVEPGSFHLDRGGTYSIRLWNDANPNKDHRVDVYELDLAFHAGDRWGGKARRWIVLRNLTLQKYGGHAISTDLKRAADNDHWELDTVTVKYNHYEGVFACLDDWYVHDCSFVRNGGHGCQVNGARVRFEKNVCSENEWFGAYEHGGCGILIGPDPTATECVIRRNVFQDNGNVDGYGCAVYLEGRSHHNRVEDNSVSGGTHAGICFYGSSYNTVVNNVMVNVAPELSGPSAGAFVVARSFEGDPNQSVGNLAAHNTVWKCPTPIAVLEARTALRGAEINRFVNNVFVGCRHLTTPRGLPVISLENNGFFACPDREMGRRARLRRWMRDIEPDMNRRQNASDLGTNIEGNDALLRDPNGGDFRPAKGSPLIDRGKPVPSAALDITGSSRWVGQKPDLGAYEYQGEPSDALGS